ncbi:MAG: RNA methyltransferase [Chlorobi bacterium]|nr:RNA methyltransferase [Chlorobiota bacterium]
MLYQQKIELLDFLESFVSENKKSLFQRIIEFRTRYITMVLEDIYQPHNASAVLRTCDCFGVQDVHIIENRNMYEVNPDVALGSSKWLTLTKYNDGENNTLDTINKLKSKGYSIVATTPHKNDTNLGQLDLSKKTALLFGTELKGLSNVALENADAFVKIPMVGFTESFNISVSAAIILHQLTGKMRESNYNWQLTDEEKLDIRLDWARNVVKNPDLVEATFLDRKTK